MFWITRGAPRYSLSVHLFVSDKVPVKFKGQQNVLVTIFNRFLRFKISLKMLYFYSYSCPRQIFVNRHFVH